MIDKLPMTREQIVEELGKLGKYAPVIMTLDPEYIESLVSFADHILNIGAIALIEENKRLRSGEFICKRCGLRKDADILFKNIPF